MGMFNFNVSGLKDSVKVAGSKKGDFLKPDEVKWLENFHSLANYIGAASLYLRDNHLLRRELKKDDVKDRILGHWGTVPGLAYIYAQLNLLVSKTKQKTMLIVGPGHGAPAILASLFIEGTISDFYKEIHWNENGAAKLIHDFSWPHTHFPSHVTPDVPGSILEGGELGYSLSTAFGAAMDNPDLMVAVVVGDGESESGPLAAAWHGNKFLNPKESGAVLPIVHLNGYKISGPTIMASMSDEELNHYFKGHGYKPIIVDQSNGNLHEQMAKAMMNSYNQIKEIQQNARKRSIISGVQWPVIIFRSMKGWSGVKMLNGKKVEDNFRSHGIPLQNPKADPKQFNLLRDWLESYEANKFFDSRGNLKKDVLKYVPKGDLRIGKCKNAYGGMVAKDLVMPKPEKFEFKGEHGHKMGKNTEIAAVWLNEIFKLDRKNKQFRYFCPDETESNKMGLMFEGGGREYLWPYQKHEEEIVKNGRISEMLSEHTLLGFLEGYVLTGRHGFFATYEAFSMINVSMIDQFCKYLKQAKRIPWRKPVPSLNYLNASVEWRQEHNGYSHQNPGLISTITEKHGDFSSCYFPSDGNSLMVTFEQCLKSRNRVNVITAAKTDMPQWLSVKEARRQFADGIMIWDWINRKAARDPHFVLAASGDYMIEESMAAIDIFREEFPEFKIRLVNVSEVNAHGMGSVKKKVNQDLAVFEKYFTKEKPVFYAFHGYSGVIKKFLFQNPTAHRFVVRGYNEEGSTTTPFDMVVRNGVSRYDMIIDALTRSKIENEFAGKAKKMLKKYQQKLAEHKPYIMKYGKDMPDVVYWQWDKI